MSGTHMHIHRHTHAHAHAHEQKQDERNMDAHTRLALLCDMCRPRGWFMTSAAASTASRLSRGSPWGLGEWRAAGLRH
jgi:hypothetical protein